MEREKVGERVFLEMESLTALRRGGTGVVATTKL